MENRIRPVVVKIWVDSSVLKSSEWSFPSHRTYVLTLVMDVTMTHDHYGRTTQRTNGALTHRVSSSGAPQPDGALNKTTRIKIRYYRQIYTDKPVRTDPIVFVPVVVITSGRIYEDFTRMLLLHAHREASISAGELPE
jgi:hypothetical protein